MDEETQKLKNLRKERERELKNRHGRELQEFDGLEDGCSPPGGQWKHRTSSQRSATKTVENNGTPMSVNGRKSASPPTGDTTR